MPSASRSHWLMARLRRAEVPHPQVDDDGALVLGGRLASSAVVIDLGGIDAELDEIFRRHVGVALELVAGVREAILRPVTTAAGLRRRPSGSASAGARSPNA
jgi:hypothetical protein